MASALREDPEIIVNRMVKTNLQLHGITFGQAGETQKPYDVSLSQPRPVVPLSFRRHFRNDTQLVVYVGKVIAKIGDIKVRQAQRP